MKIAVVDDEESVRELLKEYIDRYAVESTVECDITCFESGVKLLENYKPIFDLIIFDVDMPGMNGLETAMKIREKDSAVVILFITNLVQYAIDGYKVEAVDYVLKPVSYYDFALKMNRVARMVSRKTNAVIDVATVDGIRPFYVSNIIWVESYLHYLVYHTTSGDYKARGVLRDIEPVLSIHNFSKIYKSYIVNLNYVENIQTQTVTVEGRELPLGRVFKDSFMRDYMKFIRG